MKDIETLLNKYFEGETTCEEERRLRRFFAEGLVPEHLKVYRPLFAFFEAEQAELSEASGLSEIPSVSLPDKKKTGTFRQYLTYTLGTAAAILLLVGISGIYRHLSPTPANYVIIDGKQYTDANLIREQAMVAFRDVSLSEEEVFATLFEE